MKDETSKWGYKLDLVADDKFFTDSIIPRIVTSAIRNSSKSQATIAQEMALNSNLITMFKQGRTKVPISRARDLAKSLNLPICDFVKLVLSEYHSEIMNSIQETFVISSDEKENAVFNRARQLLNENPDMDASSLKL